MSLIMRKTAFGTYMYTKAKLQISCVVTEQLISAFVFSTQIVQYSTVWDGGW